MIKHIRNVEFYICDNCGGTIGRVDNPYCVPMGLVEDDYQHDLCSSACVLDFQRDLDIDAEDKAIGRHREMEKLNVRY